MNVVLATNECGDWETLYVNDKNVYQSHKITRINLLKLAEKHQFRSDDIKLLDVPDEIGELEGEFPDSLEELRKRIKGLEN